MIKIVQIETIYPAPSNDDDDWCPDGEASSTTESMSFRELVELMRHNDASCSHPTGSVFEWVTTSPYIDPYTGDTTERSIHFAHENPPRKAKYWKWAMKAANIIRN